MDYNQRVVFNFFISKVHLKLSESEFHFLIKNNFHLASIHLHYIHLDSITINLLPIELT